MLILVLRDADFKTKKEAAWAITNATSGGTSTQIQYLVENGCIPPLCTLLDYKDLKIVQVALNGLENILRAGKQDSEMGANPNPYAVTIEECGGVYIYIYF